MKKIKLNAAKLQLTKEKVSSLTNEELKQVAGGAATTNIPTLPATTLSGCQSFNCPSNYTDTCRLPGSVVCSGY